MKYWIKVEADMGDGLKQYKGMIYPTEEAIVSRCPFCGSMEVFLDTNLEFTDEIIHVEESHWVYCDDCKAQGPNSETKDEAWAAWKRRVNQ